MGSRSDTSWIPEFRARYATWWAEARPLLARHDYAAAFKTYPWVAFAESPWTPLTTPLGRCRIAVVTTGGLYRPGVDAPFDGEALDGDPGYRTIPVETPLTSLGVAHRHFPHEVATADMNTIFPLDRLAELEREGVVGPLAPTHYSTMGYAPRAADVAEREAPAIAARMREESVAVALVVPV